VGKPAAIRPTGEGPPLRGWAVRLGTNAVVVNARNVKVKE